jgi:tRNA(fMet)-specific endonuclease VapC
LIVAAFVLDTNTVIDYFKGLGLVAERLLAIPPRDIALPAIAAHELWVGVLGSRDAGRRKAQYEAFLSLVDVIPFDSTIAKQAADLRLMLERRGTPIGPLDTLIASTALSHGATLVTRNTSEFARIPGLKLANWRD